MTPATVVRIGTLAIPAGTRHRRESEFARWFDEIEAPEQTVEVFAHFGTDGRVETWPGVHYRIAGRIVASDWSPCYGGVPFSDGRNKNLGQEQTHNVSLYGYSAAAGVVNGSLPIALDPGFTAHESHAYEGREWNDETRAFVPCQCTLYTITRTPESAR